MKSKKTILRRITVLYIIFFAVIAFSIVRSFSRFSGDDFNTGRNDAKRMIKKEMPTDKQVEILYDLHTTTSKSGFEIPVYTQQQDGIEIYARLASLDIEATVPAGVSFGGISASSYNLIYWTVAVLIYVAVFVILFIIIGSLRKSIRNDDVFRKSNIALTRAIGILLIIASLLFSLISWLEATATAPYFAGSPYQINTSFPFNFSEIIMGVLIFIIAEIFAISTSLSEEQKLTI